MSLKYFEHYKIANKLSSQSVRWWWVNDKKEVSEPHTVFIALKEYESEDLRGELNSLILRLLEDRREFKYQGYDNLLVENISFNRGCGNYEQRYFLVGERKETDLEVKARLASIEISAAEEKQKQDLKSAKEYELFLELKNKFEKKNLSCLLVGGIFLNRIID